MIDAFVGLMRDQSAKMAFKTAFYDSTSRPIGLKRLETIGDIPCLLIWGDQDNVIPKKSKKALVKAKYEIVENAGHAPFVEKTSIVYEKLYFFLT